MNCYFHQGIPETGQRILLGEAESSHAAGPRRQRPGDPVLLIDGNGTRAEGRVETVERRKVEILVESRHRADRAGPEIIVGCALPKGERQKVMLDMLTQLGINRFTPLNCERSVARAGGSSIRRLARVCIEACKQSRNPYLPHIDPPCSPDSFVLSCYDQGVPVCLADPDGHPVRCVEVGDAIAVCVGPEGGFTEHERSQMIGAGAKPCRMGPNVLRTETAAVVAAACFARLR